MRKALLLNAILALTVAACAEPSEQAASDPTESAWVLQSGTLNGDAVPIVEGHPITLVFDEEGAGGTSACNSYFGGYSISSGAISFSDLGQTMMACVEDEVMESEAKYLEALALVETFDAGDATLTLTGEGVELVFAVDESAQS
ncbi:MAG: META domain-containing protein [Acidimicrobiia bacterium]